MRERFAGSQEVLLAARCGDGDQHVGAIDDDEEIPLALALWASDFPNHVAFGHIPGAVAPCAAKSFDTGLFHIVALDVRDFDGRSHARRSITK